MEDSGFEKSVVVDGGSRIEEDHAVGQLQEAAGDKGAGAGTGQPLKMTYKGVSHTQWHDISDDGEVTLPAVPLFPSFVCCPKAMRLPSAMGFRGCMPMNWC